MTDEPLTLAQLAYLDVFERYLRADTAHQADRTRLEMDRRLGSVLREADVTPSGRQRPGSGQKAA